MKFNFCTLFDKNYIYYGLSLHGSLLRHCSDFKLWILCMDDICFDMLGKLNLKNVELLKLSDLESQDPNLLSVKATRGVGEYCWTLSSYLTYYVIANNNGLDSIAYLDSDIFFFSSPDPIYDEMGDDDILIIKHNYTKRREYAVKLSGIYNVALVIFKNNKNGLKCLKDWRDNCLEWCYNRYEDGKFGDQKYLDYWPEKYEGVHILRHKGANVAPWNVNKYEITKRENGQVNINGDELIFYHFHTFKSLQDGGFQLYSSAYSISSEIRDIIYKPYLVVTQKSIKTVKSIDDSYNYGFFKKETFKIMVYNRIKKIWLFFKNL